MRFVSSFVLFSISTVAALVWAGNGLEARGCRPTRVPNGNVNSCDTCHEVPGGPRNEFGAFLEALIDSSDKCTEEVWNESIALEDSDHDGRTNGEELLDPSGTWRPGDANPGSASDVSNPGEYNCPEEGQIGYGDTHCVDVEIVPPAGGNVPGIYTVSATGVDDSGHEIAFLFTVEGGDGDPLVIGPMLENTAEIELGAGSWTITVLADDDCEGLADDAECAPEVIEVETPPGVGPFIRGDANADMTLDVSDAVFTLSWLYLGDQIVACEASADSNGDSVVDVSDAVYSLLFLFNGDSAPPPPYPDCGSSDLPADVELGCETPPASCS